MVQQQVCTLAQANARQDLTLQVIAEPDHFLRLQERWDGLAARSANMHPYMSHAWLASWWECFGAGAQLRVFVVKSGDEWVAAAPMMVRRTRMYRVPVRRLEALYNYHTPRCDFPICDHHPDVYRLLWRAMSTPHEGWDAVVLPQFSEHSQTLDALQNFATQENWLTGRWIGPPSPYIPLDCDYDTLFNRLKSREQSNLRKRFGKLSALEPVQLEMVSSPAEIAAAMREGLRIEAAAWKREAGTAIISDPRVRNFYTLFAERAARRGSLRLAFLKLGDKRIAFFYLLDSGNTVYALKVGYDPDYHAYSPGHMLLMLILKQACDQDRHEFDFQGTAERWKLVWTTETRHYPWLFMFRDGWRSRLLHRAKFVVLPAMRSLGRSKAPSS